MARIKTMALLIKALAMVQTVSLYKLATVFDGKADHMSNHRHIQRFIAKGDLCLDAISRFIFSLLPSQKGIVLSLDRTNWKFGNFDINVPMLSATYKGVAFTLIFKMLPKRGNSNQKERILMRAFNVKGVRCYLAGARIKNQKGVPELHRIISYEKPENAVSTYAKRWQVETCFRAMKSAGFNMEDSHLNKIERMERLVALVSIAMTWCYLVGIQKDLEVKPIKILAHGRRAKSFVKYGLEEIAHVLYTDMYESKIDIYNILRKSVIY